MLVVLLAFHVSLIALFALKVLSGHVVDFRSGWTLRSAPVVPLRIRTQMKNATNLFGLCYGA